MFIAIVSRRAGNQPPAQVEAEARYWSETGDIVIPLLQGREVRGFTKQKYCAEAALCEVIKHSAAN